MKLLLTALMLSSAMIATAAEAGGARKPVQADRDVASQPEHEKHPKKTNCLNGEELQADGTCVRIERQQGRPERI